MTKTLTEQWREGTLPEGYYYTKSINILDKERIMIDYYIPALHHFEIMPSEYVKEVIVEAPSYDEYKQLVSKTDQLEKRLEVSEKEHYRTLEQLRIATGALREYANCKPTEWMSCVTADKALKEMEGVK